MENFGWSNRSNLQKFEVPHLENRQNESNFFILLVFMMNNPERKQTFTQNWEDCRRNTLATTTFNNEPRVLEFWAKTIPAILSLRQSEDCTQCGSVQILIYVRILFSLWTRADACCSCTCHWLQTAEK